MQIVQGKDKDEALAALKKLFKITKPITVTPTGEVRVAGVVDDPKPPRPGQPMPPPLPGAMPPGEPKEEEPGSQLGAEGKKPTKESLDEAARKSEKSDLEIVAKIRVVLDKLDKVQAEWAKLELEYDAADRAESDAYHALQKERGVTKYLELSAEDRADVDARRDEVSKLREKRDAYWTKHADPLIAEFDALQSSASDPLYNTKYSNIYQGYSTMGRGIGDPAIKARIDTDALRKELRSFHLRSESRTYYDKVVRGRKEVEVGTLAPGAACAIVKPPYANIPAGYYTVTSKTTKGTQVKLSNSETGVEIQVRSKVSVLPLSAQEVKRGMVIHKRFLATQKDEAVETLCLPLLEAADRLAKTREKREALEHAALYGRFHRLVNMRPSEIKEHLRSDELRNTLQITRRSKTEAIRLGQDAVEHTLILKSTPVDSWTPALWEWCDRIVKFIERTRHNAAPIVDEAGKPTRKVFSLRTWGHDPLREGVMQVEEFETLHGYDPALALRMVDATATRGPVSFIERAAERDAPKFDVLKSNRKPLADEERAKCLKEKAVWHLSNQDKPTPAVWRSEVGGTTYYITNTHRAYNVAPTLEGAIGRFHKVIKQTA